jgi:hypothetical protein
MPKTVVAEHAAQSPAISLAASSAVDAGISMSAIKVMSIKSCR